MSPRVFGQRVRKLLKTKDRGWGKRCKRDQECANGRKQKRWRRAAGSEVQRWRWNVERARGSDRGAGRELTGRAARPCSSGVVSRRSWLKVAGGVRQDNWSEGR